MSKKFTIRFSEKDSGWETIATFENYNEALAEFKNQIIEDEANGWNDNTTQLIDADERVLVEMNPSLVKPKYTRGGIRANGGRKSKGYKMVSIRMTEEEKFKVKDFLAEIRKENTYETHHQPR